MAKLIDRTGSRYGRLEVLSLSRTVTTKYGLKRFWLCRCDCGAIKEVSGRALGAGKSKSCGCLKKEKIRVSKKGINRKYGVLPKFSNETEALKWMYSITRDGRVFRKCDGVELKTCRDAKGYRRIRLRNPQFSKNSDGRIPYKVHRLVAMMYLPDFQDNLEVNHKNGNKEDNRVENLEMVTTHENVLHAWRGLNSSNRRKLLVQRNREAERSDVILAIRVMDGEIIGRYNGQREAAKYWGVSREYLHNKLVKGKPMTCTQNLAGQGKILFVHENKWRKI